MARIRGILATLAVVLVWAGAGLAQSAALQDLMAFRDAPGDGVFAVTQDMDIRGQGAGATQVRLPDAAQILVSNGATLTLSDIALSGAAQALITVTDGTLILTDCAITHLGETAIEVSGGLAQISDCTVNGGRFGLALFNGGSAGVTTTRFQDQSGTVIYASDSALDLTASEIAGAAQQAVTLDDQAAGSLTGLSIFGTFGIGIYAQEGTALTAQDLHLSGQMEAGVFAQGAGFVDLTRLRLSGQMTTGLQARGVTEVQVAQMGADITGRPVSIAQTADVTLTDIAASVAAGQVGIYAEGVGDLTLDRADLRGGQYGLYLQEPVGAYDLTDNNLSDQADYALVLGRADLGGRVAGSLIRSQAPGAIYLFGAEGIALSGNLLDLAEGAAAVVAGGDAPVAGQDNLVAGSTHPLPAGFAPVARDQVPGRFADQIARAVAPIDLITPATGVSTGLGRRTQDAVPGHVFDWQDPTGARVTGPNFVMKTPEQLSQVYARLRPDPVFSRFARRPGAVGDAALATARDQLAHLAGTASADRPRDAFVMMQALADIVVAFGTGEDVGWLMDQLGATDPQLASQAAVALEMRLGEVTAGQMLSRATSLMTEGDLDAAGLIIAPLVRAGVPRAMPLAATLRGMMRDAEGSSYRLGHFGLVDQIAAGVPDLDRDIAAFLDRFQPANDEAYEFGIFYSGSSEAWTAWVYAQIYLGAQNPTLMQSQPDVTIPVPQGHWPVYSGPGAPELALIAADPVQVLDFQFTDMQSAEVTRTTQPWSRVFRAVGCGIVKLAPAAELQRMYDTAADRMQEIILPPDYASLGPNDQKGWRLVTGYSADIGMADCIPSNRLVGGELHDLLSEGDYPWAGARPRLTWWTNPEGLLDQVTRLYGLTPLEALSPYPTQVVRAALTEAGVDPDLAGVVALHHEHLTASFHAMDARLTRGFEPRRFRVTHLVPGQVSTLIVAGHVDLRPSLEDGDLVLTIRHQISADDYDGVSALMSANEYAPFLKADRRALFDRITLHAGGDAVPLEFVSAPRPGLLQFRAPFDGDLTDAVLHLDMRFAETRWQMPLALAQSQMAFDQRMAGQ